MRTIRGSVVVAAAGIAGLIGAVALWPAQAEQSASPAGRLESCVLDATSSCTLPHGLSAAPAAVVIQETAAGQNGVVTGVTDTSYRTKWNWHDGRTFKAGVVIKFYVHFDQGDTPTPTPSPSATPSPTDSPTPTVTPTVTPTTPTVTPSPTPTPTPTGTPGACTNPQFTTSGAGANGDGTWNNQGYLVNNNVWSPQAGWSQTISACSYRNWYVVANQPGTGTDDGVKSYPDTQKNVDIPLESMGNIQSTFDTAVPSGGGTVPARGKQWNSSYDFWLNGLGNVEVMIWTNWTMNWQYWYGVYGGEQVTIDGVSYHAWHKTGVSGNARGMWFVRDNVTNAGTQDIDGVLRWAVSKGWLSNTDRLSAIEYGFEIAYTGTPTRFDLLDYTLTTS